VEAQVKELPVKILMYSLELLASLERLVEAIGGDILHPCPGLCPASAHLQGV